MSVCITGWRSKIAEEFRALLDGPAMWGKPCEDDFPAADRYLFCHGLLLGDPDESWLVNYISTATQCDWIFRTNPMAKVCIIGSESAYRGSFDKAYAEAKASLHRYIEGKKLNSWAQQLVGISPGIIEDCGMTTRRTDNLSRRRDAHPMGRFVTAKEVASLAHHLLYHQPYISGTIIRMNGGLK